MWALAFSIHLAPIALFVPVLALYGCATTQDVRVESAKTVLTTQTLAINAMTAFGDLVDLGRVSNEDREKVRDAYVEYKKQERLVISLLQVGTDVALTPEGLDDAFNQLILILDALE